MSSSLSQNGVIEHTSSSRSWISSVVGFFWDQVNLFRQPNVSPLGLCISLTITKMHFSFLYLPSSVLVASLHRPTFNLPRLSFLFSCLKRLIWYSFELFVWWINEIVNCLLQMPRNRRRHRSRSHSRSCSLSTGSPQYDHKRRRIEYESPQSKGTYR